MPISAAIFLGLPVVAVLVTRLLRRRRRMTNALAGHGVGGLIAGVAMAGFWIAGGSQPGTPRILLCVWIGCCVAAALFLLNAPLGLLVRAGTGRLGALGVSRRSLARSSGIVTGLARSAVLLLVGLPLFVAALVAFPMHREPMGVGFDWAPVSLRASDGVRLSARWYPPKSPGGEVLQTPPESVAIFYNALGHDRPGFLFDRLSAGGVGVLAIDPRTQGASGGLVNTFGPRETLDVLAGIEWARDVADTERVALVAVDSGSAAIVRAATSPGGEPVRAVALIGGWTSVDHMASEWPDRHLGGPVGQYLAFSVPKLHVLLTGGNGGSTVERSRDLWPRPVWIGYDTRLSGLPMSEVDLLYDAVSQPKYKRYPKSLDQDLEGLVRDLVLFLKHADEEPVI